MLNGIETNIYELEFFMLFLKHPMETPHFFVESIRNSYYKRGYDGDSHWERICGFTQRNWQSGIWEIIETYLIYYFKAGKKPKEFSKYLDSEIMAKLYAKV